VSAQSNTAKISALKFQAIPSGTRIAPRRLSTWVRCLTHKDRRVASRGRQKSGYSFKQPAAEYLAFCFINVCDFERKKENSILLRYHPLMRYRGVRSWPPIWTCVERPGNKHPRAEMGILQEVLPSDAEPLNRCFLCIEHEGLNYLGCLMIDDSDFCRHVVWILQGCCNRPISEIGSIELSHTGKS